MPVDYTREFDPEVLMQALGYEPGYDKPEKIRARAAALRGDPSRYENDLQYGLAGTMLRGPTAERMAKTLYSQGATGKKAYADELAEQTKGGLDARQSALALSMGNIKEKRAAEAAAAKDAEDRRRWGAEFSLKQAADRRAAAAAGAEKWSSPIADPVNGGWIVVNKQNPKEFMRIDASGQAVGLGGAPVAGGAEQPGVRGPGQLGPLQQAPGKAPTESENKYGIQGGVSTDALRRATDIAARNPKAAQPGFLETAGTVFGLQPEQQQLLTQLGGGTDRSTVRTATEGAIDAALTSMTGAAYTPAQLATYRARFMPTIMDNAESRQRRMEDFQTFIRQQSVGAGKAWTPDREQQLQELSKQIAGMTGSMDPNDQLRTNRPGDRYLGGG
jgi:hypothetical protein